jgi:hypothetical protein
MKLPIITTKTSYVEFETPAYYTRSYGGFFYKIYDTGIISVAETSVIDFPINDHKNEINTDTVVRIRELLEKGVPISKEEFEQEYRKAINHLNIIAS